MLWNVHWYSAKKVRKEQCPKSQAAREGQREAETYLPYMSY
jgi:hypothetical protein